MLAWPSPTCHSWGFVLGCALFTALWLGPVEDRKRKWRGREKRGGEEGSGEESQRRGEERRRRESRGEESGPIIFKGGSGEGEERRRRERH